MLYGIDPMYWMMIAPAMVLSIIATIMTKTTFSKYSKVAAASRMTGAQAATALLIAQGIKDVEIEEVGGFLSDHYDPMSRKLRLSPEVYRSQSLSAIGVACHEAGHAIQHAGHYAPLMLRSTLVPVANIGTFAPYVLIPLGIIMNSLALIKLAIVLFGVVVVFYLVTLPVEWNASARAKRLMVTAGIVSQNEADDAGKVLNAAFLTYMAAAITALLQFLYYLMKLGLLGGRRD